MKLFLKQDNFVSSAYQDCKFYVGTKKFFLHKAKLVRSPFMKRLFESNQETNTFNFDQQTNEKAFSLAIDAIYHGEVGIPDDNILKEEVSQFISLLELEFDLIENQDESGRRNEASQDNFDVSLPTLLESSEGSEHDDVSMDVPEMSSTLNVDQSQSRKHERNTSAAARKHFKALKRRELPYRSNRYSFFPLKCNFCSGLGFSDELSRRRHEEICAFNVNSRELFHCQEHHTEYFLEVNFSHHNEKLHSTL